MAPDDEVRPPSPSPLRGALATDVALRKQRTSNHVLRLRPIGRLRPLSCLSGDSSECAVAYERGDIRSAVDARRSRGY